MSEHGIIASWCYYYYDYDDYYVYSVFMFILIAKMCLYCVIWFLSVSQRLTKRFSIIFVLKKKNLWMKREWRTKKASFGPFCAFCAFYRHNVHFTHLILIRFVPFVFLFRIRSNSHSTIEANSIFGYCV